MESVLRTLLCCCLLGLTLSAPQYATPQPSVAVRGLGQAQAYQSTPPSQVVPNFPQQSILPPAVVSTVAPYTSGISAVTPAPFQHHQQPLLQLQQAPVHVNQVQQYSAGAAGAAAFSRPAIHSGAGFQQPNQAYQAQGGHGGSVDEGNAKYNFNWEVNDEYNQYGHTETREGYKTTGRYYARLPDGRTQIVNYVADQGGYRPEVKYEGQAIAVAAPRPLGAANVQFQGAAQQGNYANQGGLPFQGGAQQGNYANQGGLPFQGGAQQGNYANQGGLPFQGGAQQGNYANQGGLAFQAAAPVAHQAAQFTATTARPAFHSQAQGGYGGQAGGGFHAGQQQIQHSFPQHASTAALQVTPAPYAGAGLQNLHQGGVAQNLQHQFGGNQLSGPGPIQQNYQQQTASHAQFAPQQFQQQNLGAFQSVTPVPFASHAQYAPQQFQQQNLGAFQSVTPVAPVTPAQGKY